MREHTKEPWEAVTDCPGECCWYIQAAGNENPMDRINSPEMCEADARRIVACVNACQGIPTIDLEMDVPAFVSRLLQYQTLQQQRDELAAALSEAIITLQRDGDEWGICDRLRTTLAKVAP